MRRTKLEQTINKIHHFTPRWYSRWFWRYCYICGDDVKDEGMYYTYTYDRYGYGTRDYYCMDCFGNHADFIESHSSRFDKIDVTPMREQEAELVKINEENRVWAENHKEKR